jgi:hypothetical protein
MRNTALIFLLILFVSCDKNEIEYQDGYPSMLADNWIVFEFRGGNIEGEILDPYSISTALDPNRSGYLIIDQLYDSDIRVRVPYADTSFSIVMGEQLEIIGTNNHDVKFVSIDGYITTNPVLTSFTYDLASYFFENISFNSSDIEDVLFIRAGLYDSYHAPVDTFLLIGYRETGFENVDY